MTDITNNPYDKTQDLRALKGPSFLDGLPSDQEWGKFLNNIENEKAVAFANLWHAKASEASGVPLRKEFSFEEFVKYGTNLFICKLNEDNNWVNTFSGSVIVEKAGYDPTGKVFGEGESPIVNFWLGNVKNLTKEHCPIIEFYKFNFGSKKYVNCTAVNFPLRSEAGLSPEIFVAYEFYNTAEL